MTNVTTSKRAFTIILGLLALIMICMTPLSAAAAEKEKEAFVSIDGEAVELSQPAKLIDGRVYVPVALIAEKFDADVKWDKKNEEATIHTVNGDTIVFGIGVPVVYFNDKRYMMDGSPYIDGGRTYIPLRHAAELLHVKVEWNKESQTAELTTVKPAVVTADFGIEEIIAEHELSKSELLKRNGLVSTESIKEGTELQVIIPTILSQEAASFTDEDLKLLAKITMVEAGYESYEGQLAVANIILNRVKDSRFPSTIRDVIYSGKQFPPAHNGLLDKSDPNESVMRAAKDALNGKNNIKDAVYFFNPKVSKGKFWSSLDVIATIGHHSFAK